MKIKNQIHRFTLLGLIIFFIGPVVSHAMPQNLACKLYGDYGSAQMHSKTVNQNGKIKTLLVFNKSIAWGAEKSFEVIYSSGYDRQKPLILVANANDENGNAQTVEISLASQSSMESTRYGEVRAGDYASNWYGTLKKHKIYNIQCFNF